MPTQHHLEQGYADVLEPHYIPDPPVHRPLPPWVVKWEEIRPRWLMELFAEFAGVFLYVYFGVAATASWVFGTYAQLAGIGNILTIGLAYGFGIMFGILSAAPTSGGHLSPGFTFAFAVFKGFPWKKVPFFIIFQILGAFCATLLVYAQYYEFFDKLYSTLHAAGPAADAIIYSPKGPAGILALFPQNGQKLGYVFLNELISDTVLAFLVGTVLDSSNFFVTYSSGPWLIGLAYAVIIWCFSFDTLALNTARDLGGRFACGVVYGSSCFPSKYSALAALTNIPATLLGFLIQALFFMDSNRPTVNPPAEGSVEVMALKRKITAEKGSSYVTSRKPTTASTSPAAATKE